MAVKVISKEHYEIFNKLLNTASFSIKIISPFIGYEMAMILTDMMNKKANLNVTLVTRFYQEDFISGASSIEALEILHEAGADIYALRDLHTKLYLFDDCIALVGSANFTTGGFRKNHELSILSDNDTFLNKQLVDYFDDLVKEISKEFLLTFEQIEHEKNQVLSLRMERMDREYSFKKRYGAVLSKHSEKSERIWLKFEGSGKDRLPMNERYCPLVTKELQNGATFSSPCKKPSKVKAGDKIIMAKYCEASSPYVVGRGISAGFSDTNRATDAMIAEHGWMEQYPYYHEFTSFQYIDAPISECIPLNDIIETLESDIYQNTIGKQISKDRVRTWHSQQAHLELTHQAMEYIDALLEEKFLLHGVTELGKQSSGEKRKGQKNTKSTININMIKAAYNVAKDYYLDKCKFQQGRKIVNESSGMNIGSAGNFLVVFRAMMDGNEYHRTLNKEATRYYLENIYNDYGDEQLRTAITACRKHLLYYEEKQSKQPSIEKIVDEFAAKVHM